MRIESECNAFTRMVLGTFPWVSENRRNRIAKLNVPAEKLVDIGFADEI